MNQTNPEQLAKEVQALKKEVADLNRRIQLLEDVAHRYKRTPFDKCYMLGRKLKDACRTAEVPKTAESAAESQPERDWPTVSVVIPTYKPNDYIDQCIRSVLEQDYDPEKLEIIVSVNSDNVEFAGALKEQYAEIPRVRVIHTFRKGLSAGRNYAKKFLRTDCVTYLDDDDYFTPGYVRELASHMTDGISVVCGRLVDLKNGGVPGPDTYINRALAAAKEGVHSDYHAIGSLFSTFCAKLYRCELIKEVFGDFDESVTHTEDIIFWVENLYKLQGDIYTCDSRGTEALVRRVVDNSMSRPSKEKSFAFYIQDRLGLMERFSGEIFRPDQTMMHKRFVLTKIDASTGIMRGYFNSLTEEEKAQARKVIYASKCPFLNKGLFAEKKGIAFCHNFTPFSDASAYVASKRLPQLAEHLGEPVAWTVICADMSRQRGKDPFWEMFYSRYQYVEKIMTPGPTYFNEEAQDRWGQQAFEQVRDWEADYIYSRSMWIGSHAAALRYKREHPGVTWIAEFSDPVFMDTNGMQRAAAKLYTGEKAFLNTYWKDIETAVFENADTVIFTNENQRTYMLRANELAEPEQVLAKSLVWHHPQVDRRYSAICQSRIQLDREKTNIAYFGTFYANRDVNPMLAFLNNENIVFHIFTNPTDQLKELAEQHPNLKVCPMVSHLEFLNLAGRMDFCFLNDIDFDGEINPYLPSKLADYLAAGAAVIGLAHPGTPMDRLRHPRLLKVPEVTEEFARQVSQIDPAEAGKYQSSVAELNSYKEQFVASMTPERVTGIARNILAGKLDLGYDDLPKPAMCDADGRLLWDFSDRVQRNKNTFYLYFLGLRHVYFLSAAYQHTGDARMLQTAGEIVRSFDRCLAEGTLSNEMTFNDHAQAERIENLVFFYNTAKKAGCDPCEEQVVRLVEDAVDKLLGVRYYQRNHNHGIIVDKACLIGLTFLNPLDRLPKTDFVTRRLKAQVDYAFGPDGIHRESSMDYHYSVMNMLLGCLRICQYIGRSYSQELSERLYAASEYPVFALKPNGGRPMFGDSKGVRLEDIGKAAVAETFDNPHLQYIATQGRSGEKPRTLTKLFSSGYVFLREHFEKENFREATWLSLKAGYSTRVHKHQDDLSLCLYSKGYDIFIDPGMLGYMPKDRYKDYVESLPAHTTVCIKDRPYSICSSNGEKFRIQQVVSRGNYDYVKASSLVYPGVSIYRHVYYLRQQDVIVIRDEILSGEAHTYAQYFHLGTAMALNETEDPAAVSADICNTEYAVSIRQTAGCDGLQVLSGEETEPMSLISTSFSSFVPTKTLCYEKTGTSVEFVTVIDIYLRQTAPCGVQRTAEGLTVEKRGKTVELPFTDTVPVRFGEVSCRQDGGELVVHNGSEGFVKHTAYVIDEDSGQVSKFPYTKERDLRLSCELFRNAKLMYFVSNDYGETQKGILGRWTAADGGQPVFQQRGKITVPEVRTCTAEQTGERLYRFKVDVDYPEKKQVSWWIYRNGGLLKNEINNENMYLVQLREPGEYVIMCSMRDKFFGEFFFYQFDKIVVTES